MQKYSQWVSFIFIIILPLLLRYVFFLPPFDLYIQIFFSPVVEVDLKHIKRCKCYYLWLLLLLLDARNVFHFQFSHFESGCRSMKSLNKFVDTLI